jgi:hypothetical protein
MRAFVRRSLAEPCDTWLIILIGAKGTALETMMSSILVASCCTDATNTSRPMRTNDRTPTHRAHGSPEVSSHMPPKAWLQARNEIANARMRSMGLTAFGGITNKARQ